MKTQFSSQLIKVTTVFTGLMILGLGITIGAQFIDSAYEHNVLVNIGSAIVGGSLAFFLVEVFRLERER